MSTFDWLESEAQSVRRQHKKFFHFRPQPAGCLDEVEAAYGALPQNYKEFVKRYGEAELFRHPSLKMHLVSVFAPPRISSQPGEPVLLQLGDYFDSGFACLKWRDGAFDGDGALYTGGYPPSRQFTGGFEEWLKRCCARARKLYRKAEWEGLLEPLEPFSAKELELVQALPAFDFRQVGVTEHGTVLVEVENKSTIQLRGLSVGVRLGSPDRIGQFPLPTGDIKPGAAAVLECSIYEGSVDPNEIELFRLPPPEPEDRPYYFEFSENPAIWDAAAKKWSPNKQQPVEALDGSVDEDDVRSTYPEFGPWKFVHDVGLGDLKEHPIWLWCMTLGLEGEEDGPIGGDESSMRPLIDSTNVTSEMVSPLILLRVKDTEYYASGLYNHAERRLESVSIFFDEHEAPLQQSPFLATDARKPLFLVSVPTIEGKADVEFVCGPLDTGSAEMVR